MQQHPGFWRWYGTPVLVSSASLAGLNLLWNLPALSGVAAWVPYHLAVYLVGGGLALTLLWRSARAGRVGRDDLGLDPSGWAAPRRLAGLAVIAAYGYVAFVVFLRPAGAPAAAAPTWADLCFWFAVALSASLAETLVFIGVGYGLLERGLRTLGLGRFLSAGIAVLFSSVTFGLYHYTHEPRWHGLVFLLMAEMLLVLVFFMGTRNFYLAFFLHNINAAVGFAGGQTAPDAPPAWAAYVAPVALLTNLGAFVVPFVLLHALEWKGWSGSRPGNCASDSSAQAVGETVRECGAAEVPTVATGPTPLAPTREEGVEADVQQAPGAR